MEVSLGSSLTTREKFQLCDLKECQETYGPKLSVIKEELKTKIKHWYPQWRTVAEKWIDGIEMVIRPVNKPEYQFGNPVGDSDVLKVAIQFPSSAELMFEIILKPTLQEFVFIKYTTTHIDRRFPVDLFVSYRRAMNLEDIPINLHGDLVFHLLTAFNSDTDRSNDASAPKIAYSYDLVPQSSRHYHNWLFLEDCHAFPGCFEFLTKGENGWVNLRSEIIEVGGKLLSTPIYRRLLVDKLTNYQFSRLVHHNFYRRQDKLLERAQKFANSLYLYYHTQASASAFASENRANCTVGTWFHSPNGSVTSRQLIKFSLSRNVALDEKVDVKLVPATTQPTLPIRIQLTDQTVESTSYWRESMRSRPDLVVNPMADLAVNDIEWLLSAFIQAKLIGEALKIIITKPGSQFPTLDDRFDNFDLPHLRGILAQSATSIRLASHAENVERLRREAMNSSSSVPTAVVDLMKSYLIV